KFTDTTIRRLITDPTAKGLRRANYTQTTGDKKHWVPKPAEEWVWIEVPPIVSEETWEAANRLLGERKRSPRRRPAKRSAHVFSGFVYCADCGTKMYVPYKSVKYTCAGCRRKIPTADLEAHFRERLRGFARSPEELAAYLAEGDEALKERCELLRTLERE